MARHDKGGGVKAAAAAVILLIGPAATADEWWREDGGRSWGAGADGGGAAWAESREEAWWLDDGNTAPREDRGAPRVGGDSEGQPWGLRSMPPQERQEGSRKTYNPWSSDWSQRPWGDIGSRSERERETSKRRSTTRRDEGRPWDGNTPVHPGHGHAPRYPPGYVPGHGTGPWGGMPLLPPMPAPY